jgi:hypothetical protein
VVEIRPIRELISKRFTKEKADLPNATSIFNLARIQTLKGIREDQHTKIGACAPWWHHPDEDREPAPFAQQRLADSNTR